MPFMTVVLLVISNIFMTFAWYGHLKFKGLPLWKAILFSWLIAFLEYCFQVQANRTGYGRLTAAQLKTIQEIITLTVFSFFLHSVPEGRFSLELSCWFSSDSYGRIFYF